jgi:serine/threonine protein phosphatase PrpC
LIDGSNAYFANAGDSRIIISKNGLAIPMTVDHKPENEIEKKRILKANGFIKDGRVNGMLNLSRSIGDLDMKKNDNFDKKNQLVIPHPDIRKIDMLNVNFIFIACDGVFDCLTNQEIVDFITVRLEKMKLGKILEEMLDNILPKSLYDKSMFGYDNMSAILIRLKSIS